MAMFNIQDGGAGFRFPIHDVRSPPLRCAGWGHQLELLDVHLSPFWAPFKQKKHRKTKEYPHSLDVNMR